MAGRRVRALVGVSAAATLSLAGCGVEQSLTDAASSAVSTALAAGMAQVVTQELAGHAITLVGTPDCRADVDLGNRQVDGSCSGATPGGQAMAATFDGVAGAGVCAVDLVVTVGGTEVVRTSPSVSCPVG